MVTRDDGIVMKCTCRGSQYLVIAGCDTEGLFSFSSTIAEWLLFGGSSPVETAKLLWTSLAV